MAKARAGVMPCEGQRCESHEVGAPVVVFSNEKGTLSYSCDWCGRSPYARPGTGQHSEWMEEMSKRSPKVAAVAAVEAEAVPVPVPVEKTKPAAKRAGGLLLG